MTGPQVTLRAIDATNVRAICDLRLAPGQDRYIAPAAVTIAEAAYEPDGWLRAVYLGDEPVGLVYGEPLADGRGWALVRMLIDAPRQGTGLGRAALLLVIDHARSLDGVTTLLTSYVPGPKEPRGFYLGLGFVDSGEVDDGEVGLRLGL